ncbi:MAG: hypothetical protein F6K56_39455, partial [Moorea sp. SIO3G5]|nr:hypothetical protein [Moorena sp. SIO3G5]
MGSVGRGGSVGRWGDGEMGGILIKGNYPDIILYNNIFTTLACCLLPLACCLFLACLLPISSCLL